MASTAKILIVDDETAIRLTLADLLSRDGYQVMVAENGQAALELIASQAFDLALIDLRLGDIEGTDVLAALRRQSPDTVTIMLTAHASLETAIQALRQGAHDYLFKPCQTAELRESIRQGLLKRQREIQQRDSLHQLAQDLAGHLKDIQTLIGEPTTSLPPLPVAVPPVELVAASLDSSKEQERFLHRGGLIVDFLRHVITLDGHLLELSLTEFSLLVYLIRVAPRVVSPSELVREVLGYSSEPWEASEIVRAHVYHLRRKCKEATGRANIIQTIRGVGYTISE